MLEKLSPHTKHFSQNSPHPNPLPKGEGIGNGEKVVEKKTCKHCEAKFEITDKDLEFYEKVSPVFGGKKYLIPSPTLCPDCRQQRRLSFRNERKLYKRKCDFSGKDIVSIYSPDKKYKVYEKDIWWSDKWEALDYGINFDFEKSFFEQFNNLFSKVPRPNLSADKNENCEFVNVLGASKNCYLCYSGDYNEDCSYCLFLDYGKNCIDCLSIEKCTNCYEVYDGKGCYECFFSSHIKESSFCYYCENCENCQNCIGCVGLKNKQYFIYNKAVSKEEFLSFTKSGIYKTEEIYKNLYLEIPKLHSNFIQCENSTGDDLLECKNCFECYNLKRSSDCKYIERGYDSFDCYDSFGCFEGKLCYELCSVGVPAYRCYFSSFCWREVENLFYCDHCFSSQNCFGCVGLRNKSYCILNKQYTKEEYEKLVPKIIEHMMAPPQSPSLEGEARKEWGEFFPSSISPFGYNETVANEYFPIESPQSQPFSQREKGVEKELISSFPLKGGGLRGSFNWSFYELPFPKVEKIITVEMYNNTSLLENISKIPDDVLNWAIECEKTGKPFRIIKQELEFYRKYNLPIPRKHPDQRHLDRMKLRNPRKLFDRKCSKCGKNIKTTYSTDRKEIIYCEGCYEKEVY